MSRALRDSVLENCGGRVVCGLFSASSSLLRSERWIGSRTGLDGDGVLTKDFSVVVRREYTFIYSIIYTVAEKTSQRHNLFTIIEIKERRTSSCALARNSIIYIDSIHRLRQYLTRGPSLFFGEVSPLEAAGGTVRVSGFDLRNKRAPRVRKAIF